MSAPHYHTQPHTQDPSKEIPDDAPLAQGHDEEAAADVRDAAAELTDTVKAEREAADRAAEKGEPEPGAPRAAGDHAEKKTQPKKDTEKS